jgi:hypothetical protein
MLALRDRRAADDTWMNEAITKQEELMALVLLLADSLMGKSWLHSSRWHLLLVPFSLLFSAVRVAVLKLSSYPRLRPEQLYSMGRNSPSSYPSHRGASGGHQCQ